MLDTLLAGTAAVPITPPMGTNVQGYWREEPCRAVLDHLYARALVLDDGREKAAIVGVVQLLVQPADLVLIANHHQFITGIRRTG